MLCVVGAFCYIPIFFFAGNHHSTCCITRDIKIVLQTVVKVFKRDGITEEGMATAMDLGDYLLSEGKVDKAEYDRKQEEAKNLMKK